MVGVFVVLFLRSFPVADPVITGAAIMAGSNLLGGLLGNSKQVDPTSSAAYWYNLAEGRRARKEEYQRQKEFAQHGVRWRAADAAAAGMHPLFAFGGNLAGYSPSAAVVDGGGSVGSESDAMGEALSRAGQDVGRAVMAQETVDQRNERLARLEVLAAGKEKDEAMASYYRALAAKTAGETNASAPFPADVVTQAYSLPTARNVEAHPLYRDAVKLSPDEMVSRDVSFDGQTAGRKHPGMRDFNFPGGFRMLLPATGQGGMPEEIDATMIPAVVGANLERYGWRWIVNLIGYATGRSPDSRRGRTLESFIRGFVNSRPGPIDPEVGY